MPAPRSLLAAVVAIATTGCIGGVKSGRHPVPTLSDSAVAALPEPQPAAPAAGPAAPAAGPVAPARPLVPGRVLGEDHWVGKLTPADWKEFNRAWALFVRRDGAWPEARDRWLARGGPAPFVLAENLVRYFLSASAHGDRTDLNRVAVNARVTGEPAAAYFANLLAIDTWPLKKPARVRQSDGSVKEVTAWVNDDVTRQHAALVLAAIGEPAVPSLSAPDVLRSRVPGTRRYAMYALGRIGSDGAVDALAALLSTPDWQDRGAAAKGLGLALTYRKNERARPALERASRDPDEFVRTKAQEGLSGRVKWEF